MIKIKRIIKTDVRTGKKYVNNIPIEKVSEMNDYKIMAMQGNNDTCWYNGYFLGDYYAVFKKANGFYQQVSNWYFRYGNAVRKMISLNPSDE